MIKIIQAVNNGVRLSLIKDMIVKVVSFILLSQDIRLKKKYSDKIWLLSKRLSYANENLRNIFFMMNTKWNTIEDMTKTIQNWKIKTKLKVHQDFGKFYDEIVYLTQSKKFHFKRDFFSKNAQNIAIYVHEALLLKNFLQKKPQIQK